ncbi:MAG: putative methyltransferase FkbM [Segetibacter sp.]|nr:putative methyltransferase FkbM [Segetibacter sp.]
MYNTTTAQAMNTNKFYVAGIKFYELIKLAVKPSIYKDNNSKEYLSYILNAAVKGYTVLDIGSHKRAYFFDLFKISKLPGRLISFETSAGNYTYLQKMKQLMNLDNIIIEQLFISKTDRQLLNSNPSSKRDNVTKATVIDFKSRINKEENEAINMKTVDSYCSINFIVPALIKYKLEGNELNILYGSKEILQKYKPQILIECSEGMVSRETLVTSFKFLTGLNYSGYFILDTIKIPLASFDFNIYQNEVLGFYCNNFIFE